MKPIARTLSILGLLASLAVFAFYPAEGIASALNGAAANSADQPPGENPQAQTLRLTPQEQEWLRSHPLIRTAIDTSRAPFEYTDKTGAYKGIAADYLSLISEKLGIRFEPGSDAKWADEAHLMEKRRVDLYPCTVKTAQRGEHAIFTTPYLYFRMVILTDDNVGYLNGINDLRNKTVAVVRGYFPQDILKQHYPFLNRLEVGTVGEGLEAVAAGKAFAFIDNTAVITHAIKNEGYSSLKISGELPHPFELSMGVRDDWPVFASILEKALASITTEERDAIYNRHITIEYTQQLSWERIAQTIVPLGIILAILLYYTRKLRTINLSLAAAIDALHMSENELRAANEELQRLSTTDKLTGLSNRHRLDETLRQAIEKSKRYGRPLSVIMIDLDHFKKVNDTYGHQRGDDVLQQSAAIFRQNCRSTDTVGRWGGEEFLIVCPETDLNNGVLLAEKLRKALCENAMFEAHTQTASFGVCSYKEADTPETLVGKADDALYEAKASERNCVRSCPIG